MRKLIVNKGNVELFNVYYDAITKHDDSGGVAGLRKITKILDLFDEIATLGDKDTYTLKNQEEASAIFLEEEQYKYIKDCFDKVKWHPMKSKLITKAFDYLDSIPEAKIEATKSDNRNTPTATGSSK